MSRNIQKELPGLVTVVTVHYQTPELLRKTVESFQRWYPSIPYLVFDNGSSPDSEKVLRQIEMPGLSEWGQSAEGGAEVHVHREPSNIFHGPALDKAVREMVSTPYVFFLDSDTETQTPGFLEQAIEQLEQDPSMYAAGRQIRVNRRGFKDPDGFPILLTPYLLLKTDLYRQFSPFIHHGQPGLKHFYEAQQAGYRLIDFPMHHYIDHLWRGTASKFGYRLGLRGKWDFLMNKLGW